MSDNRTIEAAAGGGMLRPHDLEAAIGGRAVLFVGHFGSGKTEVAVNCAVGLAAAGRAVSLVDLDVVKPYFRCRLVKETLQSRHVEVVVPGGELFFSDLPIVLPEVRGLLERAGAERIVICDIGGDDSGARVVASIADALPRQMELLLVVNGRRPLTQTALAVERTRQEIEAAARLPVTGLVANTHLLGETTAEIVLEGVVLVEEVARRSGLPVRLVTARRQLADEVAAAVAVRGVGAPVLALERFILPPFERLRRQGTAQRVQV
jgi:hypothetical protein